LSNATTATAVLQQATSTIPIVFVVVSEPAAQGFVNNLARPGGNLTGFSYLEPSIGAKWLELLKDLERHITRVAVVFNPKTAPNAELFARSVKTASKEFAIEPAMLPLDDQAAIGPAMMMASRETHCGLIFPSDPFTVVHRNVVVELVTRNRLPAIYPQRPFAAKAV
jgi:putative tryptophan/tyrosine transport system substrate-binding protein